MKKCPILSKYRPKWSLRYKDIFCPKKLLIKILKFKDKKLQKSGAYVDEFWSIFLKLRANNLGDIFHKKMRPKKDFAQSGHTVQSA
jgi:hypothetical protein